MVLLQRKLYISMDQEGVQHFPGGPTFSIRGGGGGGSNFFQGGGGGFKW